MIPRNPCKEEKQTSCPHSNKRKKRGEDNFHLKKDEKNNLPHWMTKHLNKKEKSIFSHQTTKYLRWVRFTNYERTKHRACVNGHKQVNVRCIRQETLLQSITTLFYSTNTKEREESSDSLSQELSAHFKWTDLREEENERWVMNEGKNKIKGESGVK